MKKILPQIAATAVLCIIGYYSAKLVFWYQEQDERVIPSASESATISDKVNKENESLEALEKRVRAEITVDSAKGADSVEVYVGEFSDKAIRSVIAELERNGYKVTYFASGLGHGEKDFLKIDWSHYIIIHG